MSRWRCTECDHCMNEESELLSAPNPFDAANEVYGCPACKEVNCFTNICDEPGCNDDASCGFPTETGYRHTCGKHYNHRQEQKMGEMKLKTSDELFRMIEEAKMRKPTADEVRKQRVSFIYGSLGKESAITREHIQKVLDAGEGKAAE